ncbi:hypothetical protein V2G26_019807 [Clonostachys chloroleuca]
MTAVNEDTSYIMLDSTISPGLLGLPADVIVLILASWSDIDSLKALRASCWYICQSFKEAEATICSSVITAQIGSAFVPEAAVALAARKLPRENIPTFELFVGQHLESPRSICPPLSLTDANSIDDLAYHVEYFSNRACKYLFPLRQSYGSQPETSVAERIRIKRALYTFEMFCHLFTRQQAYVLPLVRESESCRINMAWARCYDVFAAHEVEQLSCIEYMLTQDIRVALKCNPLIATDHVIGDRRIEEILSRGLCYVRKIINASRIPKVMVELLPRAPGHPELPLLREEFVYRYTELFRPHPPSGVGRSTKLRDYPEQVKAAFLRRFLRSARFPDHDAGPSKVFLYVHEGKTLAVGRSRFHDADFWVWGYVFWDLARLARLGVFSESEADPNDESLLRVDVREAIQHLKGTRNE